MKACKQTVLMKSMKDYAATLSNNATGRKIKQIKQEGYVSAWISQKKFSVFYWSVIKFDIYCHLN